MEHSKNSATNFALTVLGVFILILTICVVSLSIKVKNLQDESKWALVFMDHDKFVQTCGVQAVACTLYHDVFKCESVEKMVFCLERER